MSNNGGGNDYYNQAGGGISQAQAFLGQAMAEVSPEDRAKRDAESARDAALAKLAAALNALQQFGNTEDIAAAADAVARAAAKAMRRRG